MTQTYLVWLVLAAAVVAANLPFVNQRLFAVWPLKRQVKSVALRLLELLVLYGLVGAIGMVSEQRIGQISPQGWEFYAITLALFLTLAFPGFVFRYLVRRR